MTGLAATALYLAAGALLAWGLWRRVPLPGRLALIAAVAALVLHAVFLSTLLATPPGWDLNFFNMLSLASWLIVAVLLLAAVRWPLLEIGLLAFPGAAVWVFAQWLTNPEPVLVAHASGLLEAHIFASLLAFALLSIAALNALLVLAQDRMLRHRAPARALELLPPLTRMEQLLVQLLLAGWLVLTLSLGTGLFFLDDLLAQHLLNKTLLSITAWVVFGILLLGHWRFGWRGRTAVRLTLAGMVFLLLAYFGSKFVLELMLDRTWLQSA